MRRVRILRREEHRWLVQDLNGRRQYWFDPNARHEPVGQAALGGFGDGDLVAVDADYLTPRPEEVGPMELVDFLRLYRHLSRYGDEMCFQLEAIVAGRALDGEGTRTLRILRDEVLCELDAAGVVGPADLMFEIDHFLRDARTGKGA